MYSKFLLSIVLIFYASSSFAFELDVEIDGVKVSGKIIYEGEWKDNKRNGQGKIYNINGKLKRPCNKGYD